MSDYVYDPDDENCWPELRDVISLFLQLGCERLPPSWDDHESMDTARDRMYRVRNPLFQKSFITILGMTENELIAPDQIEHWERRLYTTIPKPWQSSPPGRMDGLADR